MKRLSFILLALFAFGRTAWAQVPLDNIPAEVNAEDATITELGHATMTIKIKIVTDSVTQRTDTIREMVEIEWNTPAGTAKQRNNERGGGTPHSTDFFNEDNNSWLDIYWYDFVYPSISATGEPISLSALACMPDEDCDYINNVIIGCHVTITSNSQCPSRYSMEGSAKSDVSLLMNHAGSGLLFHSLQSDGAYYNLVILPDYEGYGITKDRAHPYLYQDITARQVVDATRYGIALYKASNMISEIRHPFRKDWRSICVGYSQGGSVAMATQRFIEQNDLSSELHLAGSVCGDGPYDPMATLMYYMKQHEDGHLLTMPVVLPLIMKGMCDYNPYMKNHQVTDFVSTNMLETGIIDWLTQKLMTTDDISAAWENQNKHFGISNSMTYTCFTYFQDLYNQYKNSYTSAAGIPLPPNRSLMEDLHLALACNNLTKGWAPQHALCLYHSHEDTVVPEVNRQSAWNSFGPWIIGLSAGAGTQYDHVTTGMQFFTGTAEFAAIRALSNAPLVQTPDIVRTIESQIGSSNVEYPE